MRPIFLRGIGLWTSTFEGPEAWCRCEPNPEATMAKPTMLEGPLRRRASPLTRISIEVFDQATRAAGFDPDSIPTIWATAHGEHGTAIKLLNMMLRGDGKVSPTHFHNSVHNTASGYASIAGGNGSSSTTLAGGPELVSSAILEAFSQLEAGARELAVVIADEPLHDPFARSDMQSPLGIAFAFSAEPSKGSIQVSNLRREKISTGKLPAHIGGLYVCAGLPMLERAFARKPGTVPIELEAHRRRGDPIDDPVWCVDLDVDLD